MYGTGHALTQQLGPVTWAPSPLILLKRADDKKTFLGLDESLFFHNVGTEAVMPSSAP